ncbi:MAG: hypothetical protein Q9208_006994 [Pyrenodesmia sp. 3 TL-2023]
MASPQPGHSHESRSETSSAWHTARESPESAHTDPDASVFGQQPSTPQPPAAPFSPSSSLSSSQDTDEVEELAYLQEHDQLWPSRKQAQTDFMAPQGQAERSNDDSENEQMLTAGEHSIRPRSESAGSISQGEFPQIDFTEEFREYELRIQELRNLRRQARKHRDQEKSKAKAAWTDRKAELEEELDALYTEYAGGFCSRAEIDEHKAVIERAKAERKAQKALELEEWKAKLTEFSEINADESTDEIEDELWLNRTL